LGILVREGRKGCPVLMSVFCGTSLDGFIARKDDSFDFLHSAEGSGGSPGFADFWKSVDAVLIGRKTYEVVLSQEECKWFYGKTPVFVLSSRPLATAPKGAIVEHMQGEPREIAKQLAGRKFRHIYVDGGITLQSFLREGLVDRIVVTRVPVLIGEGIPLFGPVSSDIALEHVGTRAFGGAVQSEYLVKKSPKKKIEPLWREKTAKKRKTRRARK
jgi:dihydrofolate reductase